ncbi:MAG: hypothetical protein M1822_008868 [Bathelium mastoideum]|nr:MAG: hypothetical protein M1822_008868 [Bathelium mastoideum]
MLDLLMATSYPIYPTGPEFVEYLNTIVSQYHLTDKIQCNTEVTEVRYVQEDEEWEVSLTQLVPGTGDMSTRAREQHIAEHGAASVYISHQMVHAKIVVSCIGVLVEPNPAPSDISGTSTFQGPVMHSARWREDVDFKDKNVAVVGAGCSAAQLVPGLLNRSLYDVRSVTQIIRSPPWIVPRLQELGGKKTYAKQAPRVFAVFPILGFLWRNLRYFYVEIVWLTVFQAANRRLRAQSEKWSKAHVRSLAPKKYHDILRPNYSYGCKRLVFDHDWLRSMNDPRFELIQRPIEAVNERGLQLGAQIGNSVNGEPENLQVDADILVLANGFEAQKWLHPLQVRGRVKRLLQDVWDDRSGPQAYMGMAIDGFPNFFLVSGPNTFTGHTSIILASESIIKYIIRMIKPILRGDATSVEVKKDAVDRWTNSVQEDLKKTVFTGCGSWYQDDKGDNSIMYP